MKCPKCGVEFEAPLIRERFRYGNTVFTKYYSVCPKCGFFVYRELFEGAQTTVDSRTK